VRHAIIGGRDFDDLEQVDEFVDDLPADTVVVSGAARGVDSRAAARARARGLTVEEFPVTPEEWESIGPSAGHRRNERMLRTVARVTAFWDGESRGTGGAVEFARSALKIPVAIRSPRLPAGVLRAALTDLRELYVFARAHGFRETPALVALGRWLARGRDARLIRPSDD